MFNERILFLGIIVKQKYLKFRVKKYFLN